MLSSTTLPLIAASLCLSAATPEPAAPLTPRALIGHYNGNTGINTAQWSLVNGDTPAPTVAPLPPAPITFGPLIGNADNAKAVAGQSWGPLLNLGVCVTTPGVGIVFLRTTVVNGPNWTFGLCTSEILMAGTVLAQLQVPHNGVLLDVPSQPVPTAAIGNAWVSQVLLRGSGVVGAEFSSALYGVVDSCF